MKWRREGRIPVATTFSRREFEWRAMAARPRRASARRGASDQFVESADLTIEASLAMTPASRARAAMFLLSLQRTARVRKTRMSGDEEGSI